MYTLNKLTMVNDCSASGCAASINCFFSMCPLPPVSCNNNFIAAIRPIGIPSLSVSARLVTSTIILVILC